MHPIDADRAEPFNCPKCHTATWAAPRVTTLRCRICDFIWQIRKP
jgi:hypothetical protein